MIDHRLTPCQQKIYEDLSFNKFGGISKVNLINYLDDIAIFFQFDKKYFGTIYPFRAIIRDKEFISRFDILKILNYEMNTYEHQKNNDVCESCKKNKFYPNIFLMTLHCDIEDIKTIGKTKSKNKLFFVFCKHSDMLGFIEYDYKTDLILSESSDDDSF